MNKHISQHPFDCGHYILGNFSRIFEPLSEKLKKDIDKSLKDIYAYTCISATLLESQKPIIDYLISKHNFKKVETYYNKYDGIFNKLHLLIYINPKFEIKEKP